jgi:threonine 3-dehydrogenase
VRHAGARHVVVTDVNPERLALAGRMGATRALDARGERIADVQRDLGMAEGFDVGLEMSGAPSAFAEMLENMAHGGRIAVLGIPTEWIAVDINRIEQTEA